MFLSGVANYMAITVNVPVICPVFMDGHMPYEIIGFGYMDGHIP